MESAVSRSGNWSVANATKALGTARRTGCGDGTIAASATAGCAISVQKTNPIAGRRAAHRTRFDFLPRHIADLQCRLGLAVAVADGQAPGGLDPLDDLGIERLAGADDLPEPDLPRGEILLDQHPPHRRRGAEAGDPVTRDRIEQTPGVEPR